MGSGELSGFIDPKFKNMNSSRRYLDQLTVSVTTDVTILGGCSLASVSELANKTAVEGRGLSTISIRSGRYSRTSHGRVDSLARGL